MSEHRIRRIVRAAVLGGILVLAAASLATTLGFDRGHARHGPDPRLTRQPRLDFVQGTLKQTRTGAWELDDGTPLRLAPGLVWREERSGRPGTPASGRAVRLTGQRSGGVFLVRQATLLPVTDQSLQIQDAAKLPALKRDGDLPR
jgi:hypothetical protein